MASSLSPSHLRSDSDVEQVRWLLEW
jgi:hypothetical protein